MNKKGKLCLITGATNGIGKATAIELAKEGFHIVFTYRNLEKGESTLEEIKMQSGNTSVEAMYCNLESLDSIKQFTEAFKVKYEKIDVLINNAGIWETKRYVTEDGYEKTFAVNHLAPFLLTNLLIGLLKKAAPSRIINVSSEAHRFATIDFNDIMCEKSFSSMKAYGQSKLANILFTKELSVQLKDYGVTVNCLHPGVVNTGLFQHFPSLIKNLISGILISPEKGAQTSIYLTTSEEISKVTGQYFSKKKIKASNKESNNMEIAHKLWYLSEKYVRI